MSYAIIKRSALEQLMSDDNITKAREIAEHNARANREEYVVLAEVGAAVPQQTPVEWVAGNVTRMVADPQPSPTLKAEAGAPAQEKPAERVASRSDSRVINIPPPAPKTIITESGIIAPTATVNGAGRPKNLSIRGVRLPANVLETAEGAQPVTMQQHELLVAEEARLGITVEGTVKDWTGYPLDQLSAETVDCLLQILAKFPSKA